MGKKIGSKGRGTWTTQEALFAKSRIADKKVAEGVTTEKSNKFNAKKAVSVDGIKVDSTLECFCRNLLLQNKIQFTAQKKVLLLPSFKRSKEFVEASEELSIFVVSPKTEKKKNLLRCKNNQDTEIVVDFHIETSICNIIIETKGHKTPDWLIKVKWLEYTLASEIIPTYIFLPSSNKQVTMVINKIKDFFEKRGVDISLVQS